ncbi:fimbria/pilus outer membrane usher protein [Vibrio owensii]|uniref:fimbria/pilus outer membrane usher protein n=1 Tax=Vibrio owensii TaxID=696485 RepID=UPI003392051E
MLFVKRSSFIVSLLAIPPTFGEELAFDPSLFQGDVDIKKHTISNSVFNSSAFENGHLVDLYVNGEMIVQGSVVSSALNKETKRREPCFTTQQLELMGLKLDPKGKVKSGCHLLSDIAPMVKWNYDESNFHLNLDIPQAAMVNKPRGYIDPEKWDEGMTALFIKHNTNYYHNEYDRLEDSDYLYSNLKVGMNLGLWQFRHDGYFRYLEDETEYTTLNTYVQRPIASINSSLLLGESYTNGSMFGSLSFSGIQLSTDKRMLPQSQLGYAPEVRGVAATYAHVVIKQQGKVIKEADVPPGPFVISDLNDTKSDGELEVFIHEADGSVSSFNVPYSSVPLSVRPGQVLYNAAIGDVRGYEDVSNWFAEGSIQQGVNNRLTLNYGLRMGKDYQAYLAGGVVATPIGAFGVNSTFSFARVYEEEEYQRGWQVEMNYGRSFDTGTNFSLLAYRYSSENYKELEDVLGLRKQRQNTSDDDYDYQSQSLNQRNRLTMSVSQSLNEYGTINLSGSLVDYYDGDESVDYQASYNNHWNNISYNVSVGRQYYYGTLDSGNYESTVALGVSIPFDFYDRWSTFGFNHTHSKSNESSTANVSGTLGEDAPVSYSVYAGREGDSNTYGGSLYTRTPYGGVSLASASGEDYHRLSAGISGTVLVHDGGVTLGPYTNDSFALVEAKGAKGAKVMNGQGARIDDSGYALLPSLMPYRYTDVSLQSTGLDNGAEIKTGSRKVVPYSGAVVKVKFETLKGKAVLINTTLDEGGIPPMGADAFDQQGIKIGMVGQAGQVYARLKETNKEVILRWGMGKECHIRYTPPKSDKVLLLTEQTCMMR